MNVQQPQWKKWKNRDRWSPTTIGTLTTAFSLMALGLGYPLPPSPPPQPPTPIWPSILTNRLIPPDQSMCLINGHFGGICYRVGVLTGFFFRIVIIPCRCGGAAGIIWERKTDKDKTWNHCSRVFSGRNIAKIALSTERQIKVTQEDLIKALAFKDRTSIHKEDIYRCRPDLSKRPLAPAVEEAWRSVSLPVLTTWSTFNLNVN